MKRRLTFVHAREDIFDPKQLTYGNNALQIHSLRAAREDRLTFSIHELPQEIWLALKHCHEFHARWTSPIPFMPVAPFVSTTPAGLHLFYHPFQNPSADLFCTLISKIFFTSDDCVIDQSRFTIVPTFSEHSASSVVFQYFQPLSDLRPFEFYMAKKICSKSDTLCQRSATLLRLAQHIDLDYDNISQSLVLSVFHANSPRTAPLLARSLAKSESERQILTKGWNEIIESSGAIIPTEIGIFSNEIPVQPEALSLSGFLFSLGKDVKPNPTLFSFPSRHHSAFTISDQRFSVSFVQPTGLHPALRLTLEHGLRPPLLSCTLHSYLSLPSFLFLDKYQLSSHNFLASKNLRSLRLLMGETDLEAPDWAVRRWGSASIIDLQPPPVTSPHTDSKLEWHADISLHLRYTSPKEEARSFEINKGTPIGIPWPAVFWACPAVSGTNLSTNPFDRTSLGYDSMFESGTTFHHLRPSSDGLLVEDLFAPSLDLEGRAWIESYTFLTVILGFIWTCCKIPWNTRKAINLARDGQTMKRQ